MDPNQNDFQDGFPPVDLSNQTWRGRRMAISSLIFGVAALLFLFLGGFWFVLVGSILAIVMAAISRRQAGKWSAFAIAGLVLGIFTLVITAIMIAFFAYVMIEALNDPDGEIAKLLDQYFLQTQGTTFSSWFHSMMGK